MSRDKAANQIVQQLEMLKQREIKTLRVWQWQLDLLGGRVTSRDGKIFYDSIELILYDDDPEPTTVSAA